MATVSIIQPGQPGAGIGVGVTVHVATDVNTSAGDQFFLSIQTHGALPSDYGLLTNTVNAPAGVTDVIFNVLPNDTPHDAGGWNAGFGVDTTVIWKDGGGSTIASVVDSTFVWDPISQLASVTGGLSPAQAAILDTINANTQAGAFKFPFIGVTTTVAAAESPVSGGSVVDLSVPSFPGVQVVGLTWDATTIPDVGVGTVGVIQEASRRVLQAVIFHSLAGGVTFADQVEDSNHVTGAFFFDSWDPIGVSLYVWPAFVLDVSWLLFP